MSTNKDAYILISRARSLSEVDAALTGAGYLNDETRRTLMVAVDRSPIAPPDRKAAFAAVMGPVSGMQNQSRCMDWWERLVKSEEMTGVALDRGMPFFSILGDLFSMEILRDALSAGRHAAALMLWSRGCDNEQKGEIMDEMIYAMASCDLANEEDWIAPTISTIMTKPGIDQNRLIANLLCEGWFFDKKDTRLGSLWLGAMFPEGISQERFSLIQPHIKVHSRNIDEVVSHVEGMLAVLMSEHERKLLDAGTPGPSMPSPVRRI